MRSKRMMFLVVTAVVLAAGVSARRADAQCAFQQPRKAKQISLALVPAFVSCNGSCNFCGSGDPLPVRQTNTATGIGVGGCSPPQTYHEQNPLPGGWIWGPGSEGSVSFKTAKNKTVDDLNPPNTSDVDIRIKLRDVRYASSLPVNADGFLKVVVRGTVQTRFNGDMTVVDVPVPGIRVPVLNGSASVRIRANIGLNDLSTSLPGCTALELLSLEIVDQNGTPYAKPGLFLSEIVAPTPTPPIPTSTVPTPTPTPHTRCCQVEGGGCADLPAAPGSAADCQIIYNGSFAQDQDAVCDGASGTCQPMRTGNSFCCEFVSASDTKCIEGPSWDVDCGTHYSGGQVFADTPCSLEGSCGP